jgi:hypothetical protein
MRNVSPILLALPACLALVACGDESASPVPLESYCDRWAEAACDYAQRCDCLMGATVEMCRAVMHGECAPDIETPVAEGRSTYDAEAAGACLSSLRAVLATCDMNVEAYSERCDEILVGTRPAGGSCDGDSDCLPGLECYDAACIDPPAAGEACVDGSYCPGDLFCDADDVCRAPRGRGQPCPEGGQACADDLFCDNRTTTCAALLGSGEPCMAFGGQCADGLYCSIASGNCTPIPGSGGDCGDSSGECSDGLYCDAAGRVCRPQLADGQACTDDEQCRSDNCDPGAGTCAADDSGRCEF